MTGLRDCKVKAGGAPVRGGACVGEAAGRLGRAPDRFCPASSFCSRFESGRGGRRTSSSRNAAKWAFRVVSCPVLFLCPDQRRLRGGGGGASIGSVRPRSSLGLSRGEGGPKEGRCAGTQRQRAGFKFSLSLAIDFYRVDYGPVRCQSAHPVCRVS